MYHFHYLHDVPLYRYTNVHSLSTVNIQFGAMINNATRNVFVSIFCSTHVIISQNKTAGNRYTNVQQFVNVKDLRKSS